MTFLEELMLFKVIFEDEQILVVDKPAGLVVNRSETNRQETLQDQLVDYFKLGHDLGIGDRAGIVHRLDRETSGVLVVAKTQKAFDFLQKQFKDRKIKKEYVALVHGFVKEK
ncbi:MAG: Pseudouridine synthase [Candidatus Curtissbacteria bacterium GW2011_GWA2_40_31]|nr:MAG: Pseudouridine synthase [Candidatus Curtissbacteria bacterium GW2011_GWA2_40_31]